MQMSGIMSHNTNILENQIKAGAIKHITTRRYPKCILTCVMFTVTRVHCDPAADRLPTFPRFEDNLRKGFPGKSIKFQRRMFINLEHVQQESFI